ncbi:uncharacterized protein BT62DRAFT_1012117 [Guyanagaster necrorhizus]|uniref:Uncharacterized protein n=1 Tax=Guyanagaster necrorhizus TaxID=856835 RepID=A0A9P7VHD8_9AGAR|nr:uncharacterized protein BT62DRAFT_1012117 [Guyanagaster necrorhizus MCA 3950]KAG7441076.1 hypothetical protein BT62DRAFT_1012117 [Guyanagaster necrorhizus MCA 3950]
MDCLYMRSESRMTFGEAFGALSFSVESVAATRTVPRGIYWTAASVQRFCQSYLLETEPRPPVNFDENACRETSVGRLQSKKRGLGTLNETLRDVPPTDPAAFDAWIISLFQRERVDDKGQHPQWLYERERSPRHVPLTDPVGFDAWIILKNKADKTHHRDAVRDEHPNSIFIDMSSSGPSGSTPAMTGPSYPQQELAWWIVPPEISPLFHNPRPVIATTSPSWLSSNGEAPLIFVSW